MKNKMAHMSSQFRAEGKEGIHDETVNIKDHKEVDVGASECCDAVYLNGREPAEYSKSQENMLAQNIRKHRAP
jgi:hypothetical protein